METFALALALGLLGLSLLMAGSRFALFGAGLAAAVSFVASASQREYVDVTAGGNPLALYIGVLVFLVLWVTPGADASLGRALREGRALRRALLVPALLVVGVLAIFLFEAPWQAGNPRSMTSNAHLLALAAAAAAISCAGGAALALAVQDWSLKRRRPLPFGSSWPSLALADAATYRLCGVAFGCLTVSMLLGWIDSGSHWAGWRWEARTLGALGLWALLGMGLHLRRIAGWRGLRLATIVLAVLATLVGIVVVHKLGGA